jgi:predicted MFS family arabinose efflux permease
MVVAFMMLYLTSQRGCTLSQAGAVMAIYGVGAIIGSLAGGRFTDKLGFYRVQIFTLVLGGMMFVVLGYLHSYLSICICTFFLGCINEAFRPANSAAIAQFSTNENRTRSFSLMRLSFNLGGGLIAAYSYQYLFWIDGLTNITAAVLLWRLLPSGTSSSHKNHPHAAKEMNAAYKDKVFLLFVAISLIYTACFFQLFTNLSAYFKNELHFSERYIGLLLSWNGLLIVIAEMALIFWIERNWTKKRAITVGVLLHVAAYACLFLFNVTPAVAFIMMTLITLSEMFAFSVLVSFWMMRANDHNRGQYAGIWTMCWAIAQSTGPLLGSVVAQYYGFKVLWIIVASLSALAALLYAKLIKN